jgi:hypothetical protein
MTNVKETEIVVDAVENVFREGKNGGIFSRNSFTKICRCSTETTCRGNKDCKGSERCVDFQLRKMHF